MADKEEKKDQEVNESEEQKKVDYKKRTKNYLSIIILLAGLLGRKHFCGCGAICEPAGDVAAGDAPARCDSI